MGGSASSAALPLPGPRSLDVLLEWDAWVRGPDGTSYEGGTFRLVMWFPEQYPMKPPRVEFMTPCYHPNISERGKLCMSMLKEDWSPSFTVSAVLLSVPVLLAQPNPDDPLNCDAAAAFAYRRKEFEKTARDWTRRHAVEPAGIKQMLPMHQS